MAHKGHPVCEFTSKAACEKARRIALGQCRAMLDEDRQCPNWGIDTVDERGYCGQHLPSIFRAADEARRIAERRAAWQATEERYNAWRVNHPSIWDRMPDDWQPGPAELEAGRASTHVCGGHCAYSSI